MNEKKISSSICRRCGKPLKDTMSKERGYGPECWNKVTREGRRKLFEVNNDKQ